MADFLGMAGVAELVAAAVLFAGLVVLNFFNVLHQPFNSDEPQHLHVIWGWTHDFVQYRDVFDNHMPLFHIAFAPILGLIGERADIIFWMRFVLLPIYFVTAWCAYRIGTALFSPRVGVWAVILLGFYSIFHFTAFQFRTDNLWLSFWLLSVVVLVSGKLNTRRALVAGLLLGFCFGVSMKSILFLASLSIGAALTITLDGGKQLRTALTRLLHCGAAFLIGTVLVPATIIIFFTVKGLWHDFRYDVFDFNLLASGLYQAPLNWKWIVAFPISLGIGWLLIRRSRIPELGLRQAFILIVCATYLFFLTNFWRLITFQDYLPIDPLVFVMISGALIYLQRALTTLRSPVVRVFRALPLPAIVAGFEISSLVQHHPFWKNETREHTALIRSILTLTNRDDYILDCKGETIFRPRCLRFVLEQLTERAIAASLLPDNAPERCVETRTCVVVTILKGRFSPRTLQFIAKNYLLVAPDLRVAGTMLRPSASDPSRAEGDVAIGATYKLISRSGSVSGSLDGVPYHGAIFLSPGHHIFRSTAPVKDVALLWAQAVDRQFRPVGFDLAQKLGRLTIADAP